jgi:poly(hydroxyalkanoate) granule-associated protein
MNTLNQYGKQVLGMGRNLYLAGLGATALVYDQTRVTFDRFAERGSQVREKRANSDAPKAGPVVDLTNRVKDTAERATDRVRDGFTTVLTRFGVPTREEIQELNQSVEALTREVKKLPLEQA